MLYIIFNISKLMIYNYVKNISVLWKSVVGKQTPGKIIFISG